MRVKKKIKNYSDPAGAVCSDRVIVTRNRSKNGDVDATRNDNDDRRIPKPFEFLRIAGKPSRFGTGLVRFGRRVIFVFASRFSERTIVRVSIVLGPSSVFRGGPVVFIA